MTSAAQDDVELDALPTPSTAGITPKETRFAPRKRALHSTISRAIFALCFSESITLFVLLMCQALDFFHPRYAFSFVLEEPTLMLRCRTRLLNWQISLCLLLASIVVFIPFSYSLVLSYRSASGTFSKITSSTPFLKTDPL